VRLRELLAERDAEIARLRAQLAETAGLRELVAELQGQVADLAARVNQNSKNSSKPPSSDGLDKPAPRSLRKKSGRKPGRPKGQPGVTMQLTGNPDHVVRHEPPACRRCGAGLAGAAVTGVERRQAIDALLELKKAADAARDAGHDAIDAEILEKQCRWFRDAADAGIVLNAARHGKLQRKRHALAARMRDRADDYLRFARNLRVPFDNDLASYCTSCGGWRVRGLAGRSGRCGGGGFSIAGESDIFPWCAGASGLAVGVATA
jgi:hypothetical protein